MPRPDTVSPVWSLRGDVRVTQPDFSAAARITALWRSLLRYFRRNCTGSALTACAISSMNDSAAKCSCGPTGSRRCEVRSGDARSSSGGIVSHSVRLLAYS